MRIGLFKLFWMESDSNQSIERKCIQIHYLTHYRIENASKFIVHHIIIPDGCKQDHCLTHQVITKAHTINIFADACFKTDDEDHLSSHSGQQLDSSPSAAGLPVHQDIRSMAME
jgi:hypothetical protein